MTGVLARICAAKRVAVAERRRSWPFAAVAATAAAAPPPRGFARALWRAAEAGGAGLIAEFKRASPSRGAISAAADPAEVARAYAAAGACCLSVLTEEAHFGGADADLMTACAAVALPVLRKDFTLDPYQVVEARAIGADAVLLIMAALGDAQAAELEAAARELGLDVLLEVHDEVELDRALRLRSSLIGINNRDLRSLAVDLAVTVRLAPRVPRDRLAVGESGIALAADVARLRAAGARGFLVGESLMRRPADAAALCGAAGLAAVELVQS